MGDYPINPLLGIMPFMYGSPYYGYGNVYNSYMQDGGMCVNTASYQQQMQAVSVARLQSRIAELQMQQCCCQQLPMSLYGASMCNGIWPKEKKQTVYELDKIIFPEDPIRDYIEAEVEKVKEKYTKRIRQLEALMV